MKTAISIPDDVFEGAQRFARRSKLSLNGLFCIHLSNACIALYDVLSAPS
jgi:hypothetical protein